MKDIIKLITCISLSFIHLSVFSCEALSFVDNKKNIWMAKDFMYDFGAGRVFINQRNVKKTAFSLVWNRAVWTSKYANITFNQPARDFPFGGMNEKGLGMEILWHNAEFPSHNEGDVINESQLIQYVLDNASSTKEAIDIIKKVTVKRIYAYVHYMICDATNDCRVVEYKDGAPHVIDMPKNIFRHLGNSDYDRELEDLVFLKKNRSSYYNKMFKEMNAALSGSNEKISQSIFTFFDRTNGLDKDSWSKWNISYNLTKQKVWFRSNTNREVKYLDLNDFEKECTPGVSELTGSLNTSLDDFKMVNFTKTINKEMIATYDYIPGPIRFIGERYSRLYHSCKNVSKRIRRTK